MTNTTEMPEKIWASNVEEFPEYGIWNKKQCEGHTSYTRTDTIPSKAEVAREFIEAVSDCWNGYCSGPDQIFEVADKIIEEWEDAESK